MAQVSHISCPACKGALGVTSLDRLVNCTFCNTHLLVDHPDYIAHYVVAPEKDALTARRILQKFLTSRFLPRSLLSNARFVSATLCNIPFYEFRTRRLGTIETGISKTTGRQLVPSDDPSGAFQVVFTERRKQITVRETEMVMGDICRIEPATQLPDFGLEHCGVYDYLKGKPSLQPFDHGAHSHDTRVYPATLSAKAISAQLQMNGFSASVVDDTQYVESRTRVVYYPIWRLKFRFAGRLYSGMVDGVTGELIRVTAPEGDQMRVATLLIGVAILGLVMGGIFKNVSFAGLQKGLFYMSHAGSGVPMLVLIIGFVFVMGGMWALVWNQFRWPGEVHKIGPDFHVEKYNGLLRRRIRLPLLTLAGIVKTIFLKG